MTREGLKNEIVKTVLELSELKKDKSDLKRKRILWYTTSPKCTCNRERDDFGDYADGKDYWDGNCPFCTKRNKFHKDILKLSYRMTGKKVRLNSLVKKYKEAEL